MRSTKKGIVILIIAILGVFAVVGLELYLHAAQRSAAPYTAQQIADMTIGRVSLNSASAEELSAVPGMGDTIAENIVRYREEHGGFGSVEELLNVKGVGEKSYAQMAPYLTAE